VPIFTTFVEQRPRVLWYRWSAALLLVVTRYMWSSVPAAMISAFGSMAVAEAAAYLLLTDELVAQFIRAFNRSAIHLWLSIRGHGQDPSRRYGFGFF
jgi:hypothetical protein